MAYFTFNRSPDCFSICLQLQVPESFRSSSSFRLIPPPAIINLQKVDQQEQQLQLLVAKHRDGLNSQELKLQVINKIENSPELKSEMLKPYLEAGFQQM